VGIVAARVAGNQPRRTGRAGRTRLEPKLKNGTGKLWPAGELEHLGRCPVCETAGRVLVHQGLRDKLFRSSDDGWNLYACEACATHYLDPRPDAQSIGRAYAEYLTHEAAAVGSGAPSVGSLAERAKRILRALANGYRNARWGTRLEPALPAGRYLVPCIPLLRDALVQQLRSLPAHPGTNTRLLDVGCGNGAFLQLARSAGWSVQGIDFDAAAVATARSAGLDVEQGGLELLQAAPPDSFAWASLSHVLEHVHEPLRWLQALHRVIEPGGTLWLQTPNIDSLGHARYAADWRGLEPPRHLTLWTPATLRETMKRAGFRSVQALPTPVLTAMEVYAQSEALVRGMDHAAFMAQPAARRRPMRHLWPAMLQRWLPRRSEFHTLVARR
jgi:2-polyprenyl-3-methyl-5-hydroxy-6-metoxy-1,4-benzoquinol methylase